MVKLASDFNKLELRKVGDILLDRQIDDIITTNSTLSRKGLEGLPNAGEEGGLSGTPLREKALQMLMELNKCTEGRIPLIASAVSWMPTTHWRGLMPVYHLSKYIQDSYIEARGW